MAFITWNLGIKTGIRKIDEQHQYFIDLLNKASDAVESGEDRGKFEKISQELLNYARFHFDTEEELLRLHQYPDMLEHMEEHAKLLQNAIAVYDRLKNGENVANEMLLFLRDYWFGNHLQVHDMKYAEYFKRIGVTDY